MSYQEKKTLTIIMTSIAFTVGYFIRVNQIYIDRGSDINPLTFWSGAILLMIPIGIACHVVTQVFLAIAYRIQTGESPPSIEDERDKVIELKALRVNHYLFLFGFFVSMLFALRGSNLTTVFVVLIVSLFGSGLTSEITKYFLYRKQS